MKFEFATATRIVFGPGAFRDAAAIIRSFGQNALVVMGSSTARATPLASAMSSGLPSEPRGICLSSSAFMSSLSTAVMSVSMKPGARALTVMPREASSRARDFVRPMRPALLAA